MEESTSVSVKKPSLGERLDNFWYHYKWHTLIVLFLVLVILVCSLQMCRQQSYDVCFLYAGDHEVERTSSTGGLPSYQKMTTDLTRIAADKNGDGQKDVSFVTLFVMTNEQIDDYNEVHKTDKDADEINVNLIKQDLQTLEADLVYGDTYVCFMSTTVYEIYKKIDGVSIFEPLAGLVGDASVTYYDDAAVLLSSTAFGALPGFSEFPEDTVICCRALSEVGERGINKKKNTQNHAMAEETLQNLFALQK